MVVEAYLNDKRSLTNKEVFLEGLAEPNKLSPRRLNPARSK